MPTPELSSSVKQAESHGTTLEAPKPWRVRHSPPVDCNSTGERPSWPSYIPETEGL